MDEWNPDKSFIRGNEELVFSPVAAVVVIRDSKQLLLYRKPGSDVWELPGGAARRGETLEQTARRELAAQTGVHAGELEVWKVFCTPELPAPEGEGEQVQEVVGVFVRRYPAEPSVSPKYRAVKLNGGKCMICRPFIRPLL
ncbi:NUDIX domain-containing protein [Paenibacillus larvae]|nr:NUDIX domain-containing protein [Paenibacillus larvae]MDT2240253.1 NUDIX domain-containing protein [Paenibacillus larvae]MDT2258726.1 NUDIX domain-containing protein [Paenibacillus larvae]MDT2262817.1 NUDIX domain-containing protein [Paenibacillus larvae]